MTKKAMIQAIQKAEAQAWKDYRSARKTLGEDDPITARRKSQWAVTDNIREQLGVERASVAELIALDLVPA